ncbi:MAG: DNA adenine methylase [Anaerolineae bacterium]|nr:DNA adenine methylase [Anaerolineae bacterium]
MRYLGGKSRTARQIAGCINTIRQPGQPYWEPFVGAGWVLARVRGEPIFASDANQALIFMWQRLQRGWEPPAVVTEEQYAIARSGGYDAALTAFVGFGCSFGGKWFGGYARGNTSPKMVKRSLLDKSKWFENVHFFAADFLTCYPPTSSCLIYCDPPYDDTTGYGAVPKFSTIKFWDRVRLMETCGHTVIVSEYQAPDDFTCILEMPTKTEMRTVDNGREARTERLFRLGEHTPIQPGLF